MEITIANLKHSATLSQETHAYTATILVNGVRAFEASNHGHGAADMYDTIKGYTGPSVREVNDWLRDNTPKIKVSTMELDNSLDIVVGDLINDELRNKSLKRLLNSKIVVLDNSDGEDALYTYKAKPTPEAIAQMQAAIAAGKVKGRLVNGGGDAIMAEARKLI